MVFGGLTPGLGHANFAEPGFGCALYAAAAASDDIGPAAIILCQKEECRADSGRSQVRGLTAGLDLCRHLRQIAVVARVSTDTETVALEIGVTGIGVVQEF